MMMHSRRLSQSIVIDATSVTPSDKDLEEWVKALSNVFARDLIDSRIVAVEAETSVEDACDLLLTENIPCLVVKASDRELQTNGRYNGLFDYADVNAFLTLAATRRTLLAEDLPGKARVKDIVAAAKAGRVPVHLVSNLSEKNPIEILPHNASLLALLAVFSRGAHRTLIRSADNPDEFIGIVSDRSLLSWFDSYSRETPIFRAYLSNPIQCLFSSITFNAAVVSAPSSATVLDAMKLMSEEGVSSIAVVDGHNGDLLSAVSVTDIGKIVVPSQSNQILTSPLLHFIAQIKEPDGSTDGIDKYPVYSVCPSSLLSFTIGKILATSAHRVFVTKDTLPASPTGIHSLSGNLTGIVSIVDILSLFARLAKLPGVDPTHMQRHRRASSASSHSSLSDLVTRSRSNSRNSVCHSPNITPASPPGISALDSARSSPAVLLIDPSSLQRKESL